MVVPMASEEGEPKQVNKPFIELMRKTGVSVSDWLPVQNCPDADATKIRQITQITKIR